MPDDPHLHMMCANQCVQQWQRDFPLDTAQWYLDLYAESVASTQLPLVLIAVDGDEFVGTAALIVDDELPGATEPGPWLAAVLVNEPWRRHGVGSSLVHKIVQRAHELSIPEVFLYTEKSVAWYESLGWTALRVAQLADHDVTVMSHRTGASS